MSKSVKALHNNSRQKQIKIPENFRGYFWDCDFSSLNSPEYHVFILRRLLQYGGRDALLWVLSHYRQEEVASLLKSRKCSDLDRKSYLFWTKILRFGSLWK